MLSIPLSWLLLYAYQHNNTFWFHTRWAICLVVLFWLYLIYETPQNTKNTAGKLGKHILFRTIYMDDQHQRTPGRFPQSLGWSVGVEQEPRPNLGETPG
jgi:hypothetical protein